jgi:hypothetical protein
MGFEEGTKGHVPLLASTIMFMAFVLAALVYVAFDFGISLCLFGLIFT